MIDKLLRIAFALRAQRRVALTVGVCGLVLLAASPAQAGLKIRPVFRGGVPPTTDCTGPTGCKMAGGGNLEEIFKVAAEAWEAVFKGGSRNWDVTIEFEWHNIGAGPWGRVAFGTPTFGGNPVRITGGRLEFNNAPPDPGFFADPTPRDSIEYKKYSSYLLDEVPLSHGRIFSEATGDAEGRIDLLTIAMHEIGHLLGFDSTYVGFVCTPRPEDFPCDLTITEPRPFAGLVIALPQVGDHILADPFAPGTQPLMVPDPQVGERQLISGLDALAVAQFSSFDKPILSLTLPPPW